MKTIGGSKGEDIPKLSCSERELCAWESQGGERMSGQECMYWELRGSKRKRKQTHLTI